MKPADIIWDEPCAVNSPSEPGAVRPRVSVALCTFNGAAYLGEQLASIRDQDRPVDELVVSDDGSTDGTLDVLRAAWTFEGAPTLRILTGDSRLGVAANFERALRACTGDLILLCDQDDRWYRGRVRSLLALMATRPDVDLMHANARLVDATGEPLGLTLFQGLDVSLAEVEAIRRGRALDVLMDRNLVTGATTVLRRALAERALPLPPNWLHDEWLGVVAAAEGRIAMEHTVLLDYRQHAANQIGVRPESWVGQLKRAFTPSRFNQQFRHRRASELLERLRVWPSRIAPDVLATVEAKVAHHGVRAMLPKSHVARLLPVLQEWRRGGYQRFGRGWRGALQDLLNPYSE